MTNSSPIAKRFKGLLPVVVDVETGGLNPQKDALLEIAAVVIDCLADRSLATGAVKHYHVLPFAGANITKESLEINKIDPFHPFRFALEEKQAMQELFDFLETVKQENNCRRCVLVGHNAWFDLHFINAAAKRCKLKSPFHAFTSIDTATLGAVCFGKTVLTQIAKSAKVGFDPNQHHSALYDASKTAEIFCKIANKWHSINL